MFFWNTVYLSKLNTKLYVTYITRTDLSPIPVRSAVKSNFTSWCIQNLSKRALNWLTSGSLEIFLNSLVNIVKIDNMVEEAKKRHVEEQYGKLLVQGGRAWKQKESDKNRKTELLGLSLNARSIMNKVDCILLTPLISIQSTP